jgi:Rrf2 family protein
MFTAKLVYGLKALLQIAKDRERPSHIQDLAKSIHAPVKYLEQVLAALGKARILTAKRGVGGGYWIARSPVDVKLDEVVRILEGKGHEGMLCNAGGIEDGVDDWLFELSCHIAKRLEETSLQDLLDRENLLRQNKTTMYYI